MVRLDVLFQAHLEVLYGSLTEVLLEVRRWGYRVLLEVSTESPQSIAAQTK